MKYLVFLTSLLSVQLSLANSGCDKNVNPLVSAIQKTDLMSEADRNFEGLFLDDKVFHLSLHEPDFAPIPKEVVFSKDTSEDDQSTTFTATFRASSFNEIDAIYSRFESAVSENKFASWRRLMSPTIEEQLKQANAERIKNNGIQIKVEGKPYDLYFAILPQITANTSNVDQLLELVSKTSIPVHALKASQILNSKQGQYLIWIRGHRGSSQIVARRTWRSLIDTHELKEGSLPVETAPKTTLKESYNFFENELIFTPIIQKPFWHEISDNLIFDSNWKRLLGKLSPNKNQIILQGSSRIGKSVLATQYKTWWKEKHPQGIIIDIDHTEFNSAGIDDVLIQSILHNFRYHTAVFNDLYDLYIEKNKKDYRSFLSEFSNITTKHNIPVLLVVDEARALLKVRTQHSRLYNLQYLIAAKGLDQLLIYTTPQSEEVSSDYYNFEVLPETSENVSAQILSTINGSAKITLEALSLLLEKTQCMASHIKRILRLLPESLREVKASDIQVAAENLEANNIK